MNTTILTDVINDKGVVETAPLANLLHITKVELANAVGLSKDAVTKKARLTSISTQGRLRETVEIINRISSWAGTIQAAFAWYRSQPIPSFGDKTAEELVKEGRAEAVRRYLARIADGGYV